MRMGKIIASCGHELKWEEGTGWEVEYPEVDCDPIDGFVDVTVHATFCTACKDKLLASGRGKVSFDGTPT